MIIRFIIDMNNLMLYEREVNEIRAIILSNRN